MRHPQPVLDTARLRLRPFDLADAPRVQLLAGDRAIADTTLHIAHPYEDGLAEQWIATHQEKYDAGELAVFAVTLRADGVLIGAIGLGVNAHHRHGEIGYWVGKPYWGRGYCTEAARAVVDYGFGGLGLGRVYAKHFQRNPASGRVMQKVGMRQEGLLRQHHRKWDQYEDVVCYGILRAEWKEGGRRKAEGGR